MVPGLKRDSFVSIFGWDRARKPAAVRATYFYEPGQSNAGRSISDRCVPRRANLTIATKADRASRRMRAATPRTREESKRKFGEGKRERERQGKGDCIKSHPLLAPLPLCNASCDVYRAHKRNRPDPRPRRENTPYRVSPYKRFFMVHLCSRKGKLKCVLDNGDAVKLLVSGYVDFFRLRDEFLVNVTKCAFAGNSGRVGSARDFGK